MKRIWRFSWLVGSALAIVLLLAGCSAPSGADSLFTLPQLPIEYNDLSRQISALIADGYEYSSPTSGRNIQSVQMVDLDGDNDEEAIAFLRRNSDEKPLKIVIFSANSDSYEPLCTIESSGTAVESVYYQDLTGDGQAELVVGWRISTDVQTVAAYTIQKEPVTLIQSSYMRYSIEELDGDGVPSLLVFRLDEEGNSVAAVYSWQEEIMELRSVTHLTMNMAELARGSVVSGYLSGRCPAVYVTGVTDGALAVTAILAYRVDTGLVNVAADPLTGASGAVFPYIQLRPQDINGDGVVEVPSPQVNEAGQLSGIVDWMAYDEKGQSETVMTTYHHLAGGWYFIMPEAWRGRVAIKNADSGVNEMQVVLLLDDKEVGVIYTLSGENRENRAMRGNRQVIRRQTGTTYAGEILPAGEKLGLTDELLRQNFKLISGQWTMG